MKKIIIKLLAFIVSFTTILNAANVKNPNPQFINNKDYKISYTAKNEINDTFLVNLKIESKKKFERASKTFSKKTSVILLIDASATMEDYLDKGNPNTSKLELIKKHMNDFVRNFYTETQNELSIITFDDNTGFLGKNILQSFHASNLNGALSAISSIKGSDSRSNIKIGLELAKQELGNAKNTEKIIILFSDCVANNPEDVISEANVIKESGAKIFSFFVKNDTGTELFDEAEELMGNISGIENLYFADNAGKIKSNLQKIDKLLMKQLRSGTVQVQIPNYFSFDRFNKNNIGFNKDNFIWDLASPSTVYHNVQESEYSHIYELDYTISFNQDYANFQKGTFYSINGFVEFVCPQEEKNVISATFLTPKIAKELDNLINYEGGNITVNYGEEVTDKSVATAISEDVEIVSYTLKFGESLPDGLTLHENGKISGKAQNLETGKSFIVIATANTGEKVQASWTFIVQKANLIITANNIEKLYQKEFVANGKEFSVAGLVNNEFIESVTLTSSGFNKDAVFGEYEIIVSGFKASENFNINNYNISYENGILDVKANRTIQVSLKSQTAYEGGDAISGDTFPSPAFTFRELTEKLYDDVVVENVHEKKFDHITFLILDKKSKTLKDYNSQDYDGLLYLSPFRANHYLDINGTELVKASDKVYAQTYYMRPTDLNNEIYAYDTIEKEYYQFVMNEEKPYASCEILPISPDDEYKTKFTPVGNVDNLDKLDAAFPIVKEDSNFKDSSGITVEDSSGIVLMQDGLIYAETKNEIKNQINNATDFSPNYDVVYFEFLNTKNSNDIVKNSDPVEIYMPYPKGINVTFKTKVFHFVNVKRELKDSEMDYETIEIFSEENKNLDASNTGVLFSTNSFSPFAFVYSKDINHETLSMQIPENVIFNQSEQRLSPIITDSSNGEALVENVDFKLDYDNCVDIGTVTVKVSGIGHYSGERFFNFQIQTFTSSLEILKDYLIKNDIKNVADENLPFYQEIIEWQDNVINLGKNNAAMQEVIDNANAGKWSLVLILRKEWNLISSPFSKTNIWNCKNESDLANVWKYSVEINQYEEFSRESDFELSPGIGYWLFANKATQIVISGTRTTNSFCGGVEGINLGWNLIGMVENINLKTDDIMGRFRQTPSLVKPIKFDSIFEQENFEDSYNLIPEDSILQIGKGYWGFFMQ